MSTVCDWCGNLADPEISLTDGGWTWCGACPQGTRAWQPFGWYRIRRLLGLGEDR